MEVLVVCILSVINLSAPTCIFLQLKDHLLNQCRIEECLVCDQKVCYTCADLWVYGGGGV